MTTNPLNRPTPDIPCACCAKTLRAEWQPALLGWHDGMYLLTCDNPACDLYQQTFSANDYPDEVMFERYGVTR